MTVPDMPSLRPHTGCTGLAKLRAPLTKPQEASQYPDWGKMEFAVFLAKPWNRILDEVGMGFEQDKAADFARGLLQYESKRRMRAQEVRRAMIKVGSLR